MSKYGVVILNYDDGITYIDNIGKLFNTKKQAEDNTKKIICNELKTLGKDYSLDVWDDFTIVDEYHNEVKKYSIVEFEEN